MPGTLYSFASVSVVTLASPAASITFSGLSGTQFEVDGYIVKDANAGQVYLRLNGDSGGNYAAQRILASGTSIDGDRVTAQTQIATGAAYNIGANETASLTALIVKPAASIKAQVILARSANSSTPDIRYDAVGGEWNNTADLVTSITILASSNNFAANSQVSLFSNAGEGGAQWERITTVVLASPAASISVTGIDTDYRKFKALLYVVKDATDGFIDVRLNNDSGGNYAYQDVTADSITVDSARATGQTVYRLGTDAEVDGSNVGLFSLGVSKPVTGTPARLTSQASYMQPTGPAINFEAVVGEWANAADLISRADFIPSAGNLNTSTRLLLSGQNPAA